MLERWLQAKGWSPASSATWVAMKLAVGVFAPVWLARRCATALLGRGGGRLVEVGVGRYGRFHFMALEEIHVLARLEPTMVTSEDVMTLLEASSRSLCVRLSWFLLQRETLDPRDRVMEALVCVFLLLGGIILESTLLGYRGWRACGRG
jgi:hypothetical protein